MTCLFQTVPDWHPSSVAVQKQCQVTREVPAARQIHVTTNTRRQRRHQSATPPRTTGTWKQAWFSARDAGDPLLSASVGWRPPASRSVVVLGPRAETASWTGVKEGSCVTRQGRVSPPVSNRRSAETRSQRAPQLHESERRYSTSPHTGGSVNTTTDVKALSSPQKRSVSADTAEQAPNARPPGTCHFPLQSPLATAHAGRALF